MSVSFDQRVANFCAGPASMPTAVLQKAQAELLNWQGSGMSVMEMLWALPQKPSMICAS